MKTMTRETPLQQEQVERLMQIGAYLHHVREENGLTLEEVAASTMIQSRLLKAIEAGKLHQLPEPVYVQGFIRRYAEALGLDGVEFAEAFPAERGLPPAPDSWKNSPAAQLRPLHLYIAYIALIMASVSLLSFVVGRSASTRSVNPQTGPALSQAIAPSTPSIADRLSGSNLPVVKRSPQTKPVELDMKLTAQSWLEVEVDGKVKLAEVLPEGTERTWTADKQIRVRAGNAGGVLVAHNGGKPVQLGAPGAVEEETFTPTQTASNSAASQNAQKSPNSQNTSQNNQTIQNEQSPQNAPSSQSEAKPSNQTSQSSNQ